MSDIINNFFASMSDIYAPKSRATDPVTSLLASKSLKPHMHRLHTVCLEKFKLYGPMTDEQLEECPGFDEYAPSTVRKRRCELAEMGLIVPAGNKQNKRGRMMIVWRLP